LSDGLSGAGAAMALIEKMRDRDNLFTYVFLFLPETIGSLAYFSLPKNNVEVCYSLFLDLLSHPGNLVVQKTLAGNTLFDRMAMETAEKYEREVKITDFRSLPGNDEIVFSAPGIGIPSLLIERWPFKFYHTNMDNFQHYDEKSFCESVQFVFDVLMRLEEEVKVISCYEGILNLSKYELWETYGKGKPRRSFEIATCLMDGTVSYYDIERTSGFTAEEMDKLVRSLSQKGLVVV
jgi:aminopeptidase-like protein